LILCTIIASVEKTGLKSDLVTKRGCNLRIKKLELVGFKSFKDRTVIQFDAGITGIVGPNGCGKSNIVDALVWVMGEMSAKHLRGSSMNDVIFAGADGYAPMGLCEVSLTLENDGGPFPVQYLKHSEIMVTRRLHRTGESEYYINKEPARLRDIQEIFMDTGAGAKGFSIIQQNMIGQMITAKAEDRRMLIEEAAGITKFKVRKRESQRKLMATEQNLVRLHDIVGELKRQIDSLQRQAQRAERYRNLKREIEDLDLWLSSRQYLSLKETRETLELQHAESQAQEVGTQAAMAQDEQELQALRTTLAEKDLIVNQLQNQHFELRSLIQKTESHVNELRFEIEQARRNKEMTGSLLEENLTRQSMLAEDLQKLETSLTAIREESERLQSEYLEKQSLFADQQSRIDQVDEELTVARRELLTVSQGESALAARHLSLEEGLLALQERESQAREIQTELLEKKVEFESRRNKIYRQLESERQMQMDLVRDAGTLESERNRLQNEISERRNEVETFKDELNQVASRLYGLENLQDNLEGFQEGVKSVMFWQRQRLEAMSEAERADQDLFQPVAEVVEVPAQFEVAMEAVLGPRLQMLVSGHHDLALNAVGYLKEKNSGRSSFLAADLSFSADTSAVHDSGSAPVGALGVQAVLKDAVRSPERFKPVVERLLDRVAVVDSLNSALSLRPQYPDWTFVSTDGDVVSYDGVITGGTAESADSGVLKRRREIKELSEKKEEWSGKLALANASLKRLEEQQKTLIQEVEGMQKRATEQEILVSGLKKDLERAENELAQAQAAIQRQEQDVLKAQSSVEARQSELDEVRERLQGLRERKLALESQVSNCELELLQARSGVDELQAETTRLQVLAATKRQERDGLERQVEMISRSLAEVSGLLERMSSESARSSQTMSAGQIQLEQEKLQLEKLIQESEQIGQNLAQERDGYEKLQARTRELDASVSEIRQKQNRLQMMMNEALLQLEQGRLKENHLIEQVRERYLVHLPDVATNFIEREGDLTQAETQLKELRDKVAKIGEVNLSAIEEYDEVAKRYEFLSQQQADLTEAKEQLKRVIDRINRICSKRFKDTFEQVNERFTKVFPVLFGGGEAQLILVEDPEKGEMGIDIIAKPPGKKLQNVSLLSGGEKALTAVSLIFSIFLVRPSPYCLLDEVDAPLDDANVFRFNDLVREMAKRSQIIVVTHNKHTMEVAQKLYGVTMQEKGVSKMVSVNLADH